MYRMAAVLNICILLLFSVIVINGCKKGDTGPQGPPGQPSTALEGFAPGIQCGPCHNPDQDTTFHLLARVYEWQQSKHAVGGDLERNGSGCTGCHSTEGFIQRMTGKTVTDNPNPSPPGCFACHSPHSRGNFSLRSVTPVTLMSNISGMSDTTFDYGNGNLCAQCHKPRSMSPLMPGNPGPSDTLTITSSRWYPHYGLQSATLMGVGGFKFPGYTYRGNSPHTNQQAIKQQGCPICHMADAVYPPNLGTGRAGGHTMNLDYEAEGGDTVHLLTGCNQSGCHGTSMTEARIDGIEHPYEDSLAALESQLIARGWLDPATLLAKASASAPLKITPAIKAGVLYNYFFIKYDLSEGIHNTKYTQDLLYSSLAELRKP